METSIFRFALVGTMFMITFASHNLQAQGPRHSSPEDRARWQTEWMKKELSLDSAIVAKVFDINLKYASKVDAIMRTDSSRYAKRRDVSVLMKAKDSELEKVLTPDQFKLYLQKKEAAREKNREQRHQRRM